MEDMRTGKLRQVIGGRLGFHCIAEKGEQVHHMTRRISKDNEGPVADVNGVIYEQKN